MHKRYWLLPVVPALLLLGGMTILMQGRQFHRSSTWSSEPRGTGDLRAPGAVNCAVRSAAHHSEL